MALIDIIQVQKQLKKLQKYVSGDGMIKKYINKSGRDNTCNRQDAPYIIESVDFISRDGPGMYIYVIHHKTPNISEQVNFNFHNQIL